MYIWMLGESYFHGACLNLLQALSSALHSLFMLITCCWNWWPIYLHSSSFFLVKPGVRFREVGEVISRHASMSGLSVVTLTSSLIQNSISLLWTPVVAFANYYVLLKQVKSYCGHGIGELFHCAPNVPHYASIHLIALLIMNFPRVLS